MRLQAKGKGGIAEGDMTPMIDMVFQLIAFFMVVISFSDAEQNKLIHLPSSELAKPADEPLKKPITLQLTKQGKVIYNGKQWEVSENELGRLLESAKDSEIFAFVATAAYTGMRLSEIMRLKWTDVDFDSGRILARGYKGSASETESPRYISLHPDLAEILKEHRKSSKGALVFADAEGQPRSKEYCYYHLKKLTNGTEFDGIRFHTFRHSFASNLSAKGVDQRVIDRFMGHQTVAMQQRYQHLFPDKQQEAIEQLDY